MNDVSTIFDKYQELGTIKETAEYFRVSAETVRKSFIKHNLPYKKKVVYSCNTDFFLNETENSFYWAGFIAADGNISEKGDFNLSLKIEDEKHIKKFAQHTQSNAPIVIGGPCLKIIDGIETITSGTALIRFRCKKWMAPLQRFNIVPDKTSTYDIPIWLLRHDLLKHFIRGYFDGDGWFGIKTHKNKSRITWGVCGNFEVVSKIKNILLKECNLASNPKIYKQKNIFKVEFQKQNDVLKISNYLYGSGSVFLDRKYKLSQMTKIFDENTIILNLDRDKLQDAYNRLGSYKLVALEIGCSKSSIANYMRKYKLDSSFNAIRSLTN